MRRTIFSSAHFIPGCIAGAMLVLVLTLCFSAYSDYWNVGQLFDSNVNTSGSVDVHTPIVATVPGVSASVSSSLFTSSTAAIDFDTAASITGAFDILELRGTLSAASSTQTMVLSLNSGAGTEFDVDFHSQAMSTTSTVFRPTRPITIRATDSARMYYLNDSGDVAAFELVYTTE